MIKENKIIFGNGDIAVGCLNKTITFENVSPKMKAGELIPKNAKFTNKIEIKLTLNEYFRLDNLLNNVKNKNIKTFTFKNYIFDFSNYKKESVDICLRYLKYSMKNFLFISAC